MITALGLIPDWQLDSRPEINPFLNPHVSMPDGWTQAYTVQPTGASMSPIQVPIPSSLYGPNLGQFCIGCAPQFGYPVLELPKPLSGVSSWVWEHRKGVALGVVALVGLSLLGGLSAILK